MKDVRAWLACAVVGVSFLALPGSLRAADSKPTTGAEFVRRMQQEGWREMTPGVLQRIQTGKKTEVLAYGKAGLEWAVIQAKNRLGFFLKEYRRHPTPDGANALVDQNQEVKRLELALAAAQPTRAGDYERFLNASCDFSYGATADAYELTTSQGVGASAISYFNNSSCSGSSNCGYSGVAYSSVYMTGTVGNVVTIKFSEPGSTTLTGASINNNQTQTVAGTSACYAEATASVTVAALGLFMSVTDSVSTCSIALPPSINAINGLTYFYLNGYNCQNGFYTASVSGGTAPYTYRWYWNGVQVGTSASYSRNFCGSGYYDYVGGELSVQVTDSLGQMDLESTEVWVETYPTGGNCRDPFYNDPYPPYYQPYQDFPIC